MLSSIDSQLLAIFALVWLAGCVAYGRPQRPRMGIRERSTSEAEAPAGSSELPWLVSLGIVFLYPVAVILAPSIALSGNFTISFPGDGLAQFAGLVLILLGGILLSWAFRSLGRFVTVQIRLKDDHAIVGAGPYARIRHPIYTANILLSVGITLAFLSLWLWIPLAVIFWCARSRAIAEERLFLGSVRLGPAYASYMARTGRFLPSLAGQGRGMP